MKNAKFLSIISAVLIAAVVFVSCKDDFTEEDALNAQQQITFNVVVQNANNKTGIEGATVSIVKDGETVEGTTNALGVATFKDIKIGSGIPVTISKDGFSKINYVADASNVGYRDSEVTGTFYLISLTESVISVKGKVEIESDLSNLTREKVTTGKVVATIEDGNYNGAWVTAGSIVVEATIGADGTYELKLPTFGTGVEYTIVANDLEVDQKISYNRKQGEAAFPATLPKVETVKTVFANGASALSIPFVQAVFATVNGTTTGTPASLYVETDPTGKISFIGVNSSGSGYTGATLPVTITSLFGGTGATATANISGGSVTSVTINQAGSGYPVENFDTPNANNYISASSASNVTSTNYSVKPGDIKIRNIFYGTGSSRPIDIQ